jgi:VanW like protein
MSSEGMMQGHVLARVPSRLDMAVFGFKASLFRLRRMTHEALARQTVRPLEPGFTLRDAPVVARISSPLWNGLTGVKEHALTAGKIHNLRLALKAIDGIEVMPGQVFSFWKQVGRTTRRRGFVDGRELREGCLVRSIGGGLCQLSNGLYEAALDAGLEIVERHAHSRIVPGSRAAQARDATVFWNYVDLRFRSKSPFRIEAALTRGRLEIIVRGGNHGRAALHPISDNRHSANDCTTCNQTDCHLNDPDRPQMTGSDHPTAWLVDACWPEFAKLIRSKARKEDALFVPQRLKDTSRYAWPKGVTGTEKRATFIALRRALALRRAPVQGRVLQTLLMRYDEEIARSYARQLSHLHTHAVVSLSLLPHLWRLGVLAGRTFDVLMERAPMSMLEATLDDAAERLPESPTLADFRAPPAIAEGEAEALAEARYLYTPHREIAKFDPARTALLDWVLPSGLTKAAPGGKTILFPASALARKGAYAVRDALQGLDAELMVTGRAHEHAGDFWGGIKVSENAAWPSELAAVVLPAIVEHQPRALLRALAMGLPVIASEACGLGDLAGVTTVPMFDGAALRNAIASALS